MFTYEVDGKKYTYLKEIGQEEAERRVRAFNEKQANLAKARGGGSYEGFFTEAGEGVLSGLSKIPEGLATTYTLLQDSITGGRATDTVEEWFDGIRSDLGIDPEGAAGKVTEALVQFGIPGIAAASYVSKAGRVGRILQGRPKIGARNPEIGPKNARVLGTNLSGINKARDPFRKFKKDGQIVFEKQTKAQKLGRYATMLTAAGFADAIVSTDDTQTIGDFFDAGPTNTIDAVGLDGQERAFAKILNKLKIGLEGGVATAVIPPALGASLKVLNKTLSARPIEALSILIKQQVVLLLIFYLKNQPY